MNILKVNSDEIKSELKSITFPAIILDTEFFNSSHDKSKKYKDFWFNLKNEKSNIYVYILNYAFIKNFNDLNRIKWKSKIISKNAKRKYNDKNYDFVKDEKKIIEEFNKDCFKHGPKTIITAGGRHDYNLILKWIKVYKNSNRNFYKGFLLNSVNDVKLNEYDVYDNLLNKFQLIDEVNNTSNSITSMSKLFEHIKIKGEKGFKQESQPIYDLCCDAVELFLRPKGEIISIELHNDLTNSLAEAIRHCFNDILKICYFLDLCSGISYYK